GGVSGSQICVRQAGLKVLLPGAGLKSVLKSSTSVAGEKGAFRAYARQNRADPAREARFLHDAAFCEAGGKRSLFHGGTCRIYLRRRRGAVGAPHGLGGSGDKQGDTSRFPPTFLFSGRFRGRFAGAATTGQRPR